MREFTLSNRKPADANRAMLIRITLDTRAAPDVTDQINGALVVALAPSA